MRYEFYKLSSIGEIAIARMWRQLCFITLQNERAKTKVEYKDRFKDQGAEGYSKKSSSVLNTLPKNTLAQDSVSKQWFLFWRIGKNSVIQDENNR